MHIAIIGKGTSAIISALNCIKRGHQVTFFYDPATPHINVGESTTPVIHKLIYDALGVCSHRLIQEGIASYKMGINFVDWGVGKKFYHNFAGESWAIHFDTKIFNDYIHSYLLEHRKASYVGKRVEDAQDILNEYDFVINCAGWEDESSYIDPAFKSVNAAVLFTEQLNMDCYDDTLRTLHLATEDGWQFGLPFPSQNIIKCGYLFDKNLTSHSEVEKKISGEVYETFSWTPRYAKELIPEQRVSINGNRLFFIEPLQALSLDYTNLFSEFICDYLEDPTEENRRCINSRYLQDMWAYQISLAYHYQFGSIHDSKFWNDITKNAKDMMKYQFNGPKEVFEHNLKLETDTRGGIQVCKMGIFTWEDHQYLQEGMKN